MKLGTQTGSLSNHIMSRAVIGQPEPHVGMGCTVLGWTDRHAATIVDAQNLKGILLVQQDIATRADKNGMSESQDWNYERNPNGRTYWFKRDDSGMWHEMRVNEKTGRLVKVKHGLGLRIGERDEYYDFSF